jgi:LacI family repressor for deo operon, udp, cdd, tsx, nupC, and nupG
MCSCNRLHHTVVKCTRLSTQSCEPKTKVRAARQRRKAATSSSVTIRDVAAKAGVSTATVSRALTSPEQVSPDARARVAAAIRATGYTPNATARNLRSRSTKMVLSLVPGMSNTFFNPILNAIEDTLWASGYGMIIGETGHNPAKEAHYARLVRSGQVDGVILFTGRLPRDEAGVLSPGHIPMALVCVEIPGEDSISVFDVANRATARAAVDYLIACGHRRIAHIFGPPDNVEARERRRGYLDSLRAAGISVDDSLIWGDGFRYETGVASGHRYLDLGRDRRPTAVFAGADGAAVGFIKTVAQAGVRIPEDVSIVGFDDIDFAEVIDPPLTTMRQPREALGRAAARDLVQRMAGGAADLPPTRLRLPCKLVKRGSVGEISEPKAKIRTKRRRSSAPIT